MVALKKESIIYKRLIWWTKPRAACNRKKKQKICARASLYSGHELLYIWASTKVLCMENWLLFFSKLYACDGVQFSRLQFSARNFIIARKKYIFVCCSGAAANMRALTQTKNKSNLILYIWCISYTKCARMSWTGGLINAGEQDAIEDTIMTIIIIIRTIDACAQVENECDEH